MRVLAAVLIVTCIPMLSAQAEGSKGGSHAVFFPRGPIISIELACAICRAAYERCLEESDPEGDDAVQLTEERCFRQFRGCFEACDGVPPLEVVR